MPDAQPWTPWSEETLMDAELREAFKGIDAKLDAIQRDASDYRERIGKVEEHSKAAHHRLDAVVVDVRDAHAKAEAAGGPGTRGWVAILVAAIAAAGSAVVTWLGRDK